MAFYPLEKLSHLHEGYRQVFAVAGKQILLLVHNDKTLLMNNACPHAGHPLDKGTLEGDCIRCPLHGICFNVLSGKAENVNNLPAQQRLQFYPPAYREQTLGIEL